MMPSLKPYTIMVIPLVDLRGMSSLQAGRAYQEAYRTVVLAANFADIKSDWQVNFKLIVPSNISLQDLGGNCKRCNGPWRKR